MKRRTVIKIAAIALALVAIGVLYLSLCRGSLSVWRPVQRVAVVTLEGAVRVPDLVALESEVVRAIRSRTGVGEYPDEGVSISLAMDTARLKYSIIALQYFSLRSFGWVYDRHHPDALAANKKMLAAFREVVSQHTGARDARLQEIWPGDR